MHTVFDARPAQFAEAVKAARAASPAPVKPSKEATGPISLVAIPTPSRPGSLSGRPALRAVPSSDAPTELAMAPIKGEGPSRSEVTMIPILPPPPETPSRLPVLLAILVVCLAGWGVLKLREARQQGYGSRDEAAVEDSDYYDLAVGSIVSDTQMQFRRITDAEAARKTREEIYARERRLRVELTEAPLTEAHRLALSNVLDEVVRFLKNDVGRAIDGTVPAAAVPGSDDEAIVIAKPGAPPAAPKAVPGAIDQAALKRANQMLAALPH
jgi:hypothetical protein